MKTLFTRMLLAGAMTFTGLASAQVKIAQSDIAVTFTAERSKITNTNCGCFWLYGGSADGSVTFFKGLGIAANLTGEIASNITPGVGLNKVSFMAGPRYTSNTSRLTGGYRKMHGTQLFAEALFGGVHGFDSVFPARGGATPTASSFAMQVGGGVDVLLFKGFGIRALEADYVRSSLPNSVSNNQNDLRLAFGISYRR